MNSYFSSVKEQFRTVNEILTELQEWFAGTDVEDYLHLAEEPWEDDLEYHPSTTYGEMAILLSGLYAYHLCLQIQRVLFEEWNIRNTRVRK